MRDLSTNEVVLVQGTTAFVLALLLMGTPWGWLLSCLCLMVLILSLLKTEQASDLLPDSTVWLVLGILPYWPFIISFPVLQVVAFLIWAWI